MALSSALETTNNITSTSKESYDDPKLKLQFRHVSYTVKLTSKKSVNILDDLCGELKSGRLTAILGPSGAGKTTMLNVLSGFKDYDVTGQFKVNGKERDLASYRKLSSYIPQDFVMLNLLTVEETLKVSANLKLPTQPTAAVKHKIIEDIIKLLSMEDCRYTLVRDLSGGERKRLSIGIELVTNPPLMFFDEPTSGLDSVASLQVLTFLQKLAHDGRVIVCVVHQPSSRLMQLFDDIVVVSKGQVLYCGLQEQMLPQFAQDGFVCPPYYNPADFVLEVSSGPHTEQIVSLIHQNKAKHCMEVIEKNSSAGEHITIVDEKSMMLGQVDQLVMEMGVIGLKQQSYHSHTYDIQAKTQVSLWRQFTVLLKRSLLSMSRNLISVQMRVVMHIVVAILLGIVYWDIGNNGAMVLTNTSNIFFVQMFVFFANAMPSILSCPQDTAVFVREYLNGCYTISAYYLAKIISEIPMLFACPTFFVSIVYFMTGQPQDWSRFAMCWGIALLMGVIGHLLGLIFGSLFQLQLAIFLVPTVAIPFMIFSGFFIRVHEVIVILRPLCNISFFRFTLEGYVQAIYGYNRPNLECRADFCYFKSPEKFLKEMNMNGDLYGTDVLALIIWIVLLLVTFYLSLVLRIKRAQ